LSSSKDKDKVISSIAVSFLFIFFLWLVKIFETYTGFNLTTLGVFPRRTSGLVGVLTSPLIHADFSHLVSNTITLFVLMFVLFYTYRKSAIKVFIIVYIFSGLSVWLLARPAYHIGASGLVYGLLSFLFFIGVLRKDSRSIALSLLITFLYGSLVWGVLPIDPKVSFESHLLGAIAGAVCAVIFRKSDPVIKYDWEYEEESEEEEEDYTEDNDGVYLDGDAEQTSFDEDIYYDEVLEKLRKKEKKDE
jgi:membrane associated rhomboid family serine protease